MPKGSKKHSRFRAMRVGVLALIGLAVLLYVMLFGNNIAILNPKGLIAEEQLKLIVFSVVLLLIVAVPVVFALYFTAWKYRESNAKAAYAPETRESKLLAVSMWAIPSVFMLVLAVVMIPATHKLEPKKVIAGETKPLTVQVVATRWKWVFIYPEQKIATVNFLQIPVDTPVTFELTADEAPMSSFWIPNLGGMLYAMNGHVNRLNLMATTPGDYPGSTAEINGAGFAGMKFTARAGSREEFDLWVQGVQLTGKALTRAEYDKLVKPSEDYPATFYSEYENDLYDKVLMKYAGSGHNHEQASDQPAGNHEEHAH